MRQKSLVSLFIIPLLLVACSVAIPVNQPSGMTPTPVPELIPPTATTTPTATPETTPTPSSVSILGQEYTAVAPPDGATSADELASQNGVAQTGREYIYSVIDNQTYLVDTFNGERDMVWQDNTWSKVEDAGVKFGYLLQPGDFTKLNYASQIINDPELADILWKGITLRWTGNTKIVNITDPAYSDHYPNGVNYLAIQVVARLGTDTNGKDVSLWLAVIQDKSTAVIPTIHINQNGEYPQVNSESLLGILGKPGEQPFWIKMVLNPSVVTTSNQVISVCGNLGSVEFKQPNYSDAWGAPELCRVQFDQTKPFEGLLLKINAGTITQAELDQMGFLAITSKLTIGATVPQ